MGGHERWNVIIPREVVQSRAKWKWKRMGTQHQVHPLSWLLSNKSWKGAEKKWDSGADELRQKGGLEGGTSP